MTFGEPVFVTLSGPWEGEDEGERMARRVFHIPDAGILATIAMESKAVKLRMKNVFRLALESQY